MERGALRPSVATPSLSCCWRCRRRYPLGGVDDRDYLCLASFVVGVARLDAYCIWLVALSAQVSWREERFAELYLSQTSAGNREISVLFADLQGFTAFSETHEPEEVTRMLNECFAAAVPAVKTPYGGDVDRIIGDALMVTFNKRGDQPDHAVRAAGAGLALQEATSA